VPDFRSTAKFLGAYGAGVVTAGFFLSAPIEQPRLLQRAPDFAPESTREQNSSQLNSQLHLPSWVLLPPTMPFTGQLANPPAQPFATTAPPSIASAQASAPVQQQQSTELRTSAQLAQPETFNQTTTGSSAVAADQNVPSVMGRQDEPSCNVSVCRRFYRSFDEATCTYQPYGGGARELCTR
jgi:hypothetical protein